MAGDLESFFEARKQAEEKAAQRELEATEILKERNFVKKAGLYKIHHDRRNPKIIDVYEVPDQGWFWGHMSDCGNHMTNHMWLEAEYIGPATDEYLDEVYALMKASLESDD